VPYVPPVLYGPVAPYALSLLALGVALPAAALPFMVAWLPEL
jgi:hypothetical protein